MKGMQRIVHGKGFRGVLDYVSGSPVSRFLGGNMGGSAAKDLAKEFGAIRRVRPDIEKPVWHQSLRLPKGDSLSDEEWVRFADDYMKRMGFTDQHARTYWLHDEEDGQHIHIVACRVSIDGKVHDSSHQSMKSTPILTQMEREYGLTLTPGPEVDESGKVIMPEKRKLKKGEIEQALRTGEEPPRQKLQRLVDEARRGRPSALQFAERLEAAGVVVVANLASTGRLNGFSFEIDGVAFKGSQLGKAYAWGQLSKEVVYEQARDSEGLKRFGAAVRRGKSNEGAARGDRSDAASFADGEESGRAGEPIGAISSVVSNADRGQPKGDSFSRGDGGTSGEGKQGGVIEVRSKGKGVGEGIPDVGRILSEGEEGEKPIALGSRFLFKPSDIGSYQRVLDLGGAAAGSASYRSKLDAWRRQHQALQAPLYRITLTSRRDDLKTYNLGKGKGEGGGERFYKAQEVADIIPTLSRQNARGYDVYITPKDPDYHYLVVDDMTSKGVRVLRANGYEPVLIQSSSEGNMQCVVKAPRSAGFKEEQVLANQLVQYLNKELGDPNFSGVVHPFRMAGFSNKKEGRKDFFTRILHAGHRVCGRAAQVLEEMREDVRLAREKQRAVVKNRPEKPLERPCADVDDAWGVLCVESYQSVLGHVKAAGWPLDMSRVDFRVAKILLREGVPNSDVEALLLSYSEGLYERHSNPVDYVHRTVVNALIELEQAQRSSSITDYQETYCDNDVARSSIPRARF